MNIYTRQDYKILKNILDRKDDKKGKVKSNGTSIKEIVEKTGLSDKKVRNTIKNFIEDGFVIHGVSDGKTRMYCLTVEGLEELLSIHNSIIEEE